MKTAALVTFAATALSLVSAAPATGNDLGSRGAVAGARVDVTIPPNCKICDSFGLACVAACLAGGPLDPLCDICAGPSIGACLQVCQVNNDSSHLKNGESSSIG